MKVVWGTLLAASLVANIVLLRVRDEVGTAATVGHRADARASLTPTFRGSGPSGSGPADSDLGSLDDTALEHRLAAAEARLAELAKPREKFAHGTRSPDVEARVKPYLDDVFAGFKDLTYTVECRGRVCKIDAPIVRGKEWTWPLQNLWPRRALFGAMSFGPEGVFVELLPPEQIPSAFLDGMTRAGGIRARKPCGFATSLPGDLTWSLAYDAATRRVTRELTGSLAAQPIGLCTSKAIDEVIATTELPPEMTRSLQGAPLSVSLPVLDDD